MTCILSRISGKEKKMKKEVMIALRHEVARTFDEFAEMDSLRWAESHGTTVDWDLVKEVHDVLKLRQEELADAEWHQMRRRQWAAHTLCGHSHVRDFPSAVRAAVRLFNAYDRDCGGAEDVATLKVRAYVAGSDPSDEVLAELARVADYQGHVRLARILRAGIYGEAEARADKVQDELRLSLKRRKRY